MYTTAFIKIWPISMYIPAVKNIRLTPLNRTFFKIFIVRKEPRYWALWSNSMVYVCVHSRYYVFNAVIFSGNGKYIFICYNLYYLLIAVSENPVARYKGLFFTYINVGKMIFFSWFPPCFVWRREGLFLGSKLPCFS
jgi:hypothetical protein